MPFQRYVSDELTHFVGRGKPESEQYGILVSILRSGILKSRGCDVVVEQTPSGPQKHVSYAITYEHDRALSSNSKFQPSIVCFADIPADDFALHMRKYSSFGIAFRKEFLLGRGASPVFYIAARSSTNVRNPDANNPSNFERLRQNHAKRGSYGSWENFSRSELFDVAERTLQQRVPLFAQTVSASCVDTDNDRLLREFLTWSVFAYIKFFDPTLPQDHPDNYYMEREWRVVGAVEFGLGDVERILVPRTFARRLRDEFPAYFGQVTFTA